MERHQPRKRFGQHFLVDANYIARIVDAIAPARGDNLIEIGPGLAALTRALIGRSGKLTAIEIDRDLAARLAQEFPGDALQLHVADALTFDFSTLGRDLRVVGNLPYNISSPLLFHLAGFESQLRDLHVMLQREVVARMTAAPGTADYGRLSVMLQAKFSVVRLFTVPAGAFRPPPQVESAVARLVPLGERKPVLADAALFSQVVGAAFSHRRKTLRNALSEIASANDIGAAAIDPNARGETLSVADFARLTSTIAAKRGG